MHSITSVIVIDFIRGYFPVFPPIGASNDAHFFIYIYFLPDKTRLNINKIKNCFALTFFFLKADSKFSYTKAYYKAYLTIF